MTALLHLFFFFFFNDTATTEIYTLSLHDALPISGRAWLLIRWRHAVAVSVVCLPCPRGGHESSCRSEEHTSELQSQSNLVCRLLLEKKKKHISYSTIEHTKHCLRYMMDYSDERMC